MARYFHLSCGEALRHLDTYMFLDAARCGRVSHEQFARLFAPRAAAFARRLFVLADFDADGALTFREYIVAMAVRQRSGEAGGGRE